MKKVKILQIIPGFGIGGAEKVVLDYLTYLNNDEFEIRAISMYSNQNTHYDKLIESRGLNVFYLDKKPGLDLSMIKKIRSIISDFQPDVIHSHMYCMKYLLFSTWTKKIKQFHTIHNEPQKDAVGIDKFFNKMAFSFFGVIPIGLSEELTQKINRYYNVDTSLTLKNGLYLEQFKNIEVEKDDVKKMLGLGPNTLLIGHVGRFFEQKNHSLLIDIFADVYNQDKESYLILVGDGELRTKVENKVEKMGLDSNILFLGVREDIPQIMKAIDVFLFPSLHEGFPITLLEAQAAGVRCIISDTIDSNCILSENTISISLDAPINKWTLAIMAPTIKSKPLGNIDDYDIYNVVEKLGNIYKRVLK